MVFLTSQQLQKTGPVAPTVPQVTPKAAAPACTLQFSLGSTPTVTPTPTGSPTPTPSSSPTATPTHTPTATPTPLASCNSTCITNSDCVSELTCSGGYCRNPSCVDSTTCVCAVATSTPTPTPIPTIAALVTCNSVCTVNADCLSGLVCASGACRNPSCTDKTNCSCEVALNPTPQIPISGTGPSILGATAIGSGILLLLLGFLL